MRTTPILALLSGALLLWSAPALGQSKIGIFAIGISGLDPGLEKTAIDALATTTADFEGYEVVSKTELEAMLNAENLKDTLGCDDISCLAEIGAAAGVERIIAGSISKVEGALLVSLQLINTARASVENRVTLKWPGGEGELTEVLGAGAEQLVLLPDEQTPGGIGITGIHAAAVVSIDGAIKGLGPITLADIPIGLHNVAITSDDHEPYAKDVVVRRGKTLALNVLLTPLPDDPFYTTWWFWTGTGVLVAGGVVAGILAGTASASSDPAPTGVQFTVANSPNP